MDVEPTSIIANEEGKFNRPNDMSPLEHILMGSTLYFSNGRIFSSDLLNQDYKIRTDREFLLKPYGLTTKKSNIAEVAKRRRIKKTIDGSFFCFYPDSELISKYQFRLSLSECSEDGSTPNEFRFQLIKNEGGVLEKFTGEDLKVAEKVAITPALSGLFSVERNAELGLLTVRYLPLLGK